MCHPKTPAQVTLFAVVRKHRWWLPMAAERRSPGTSRLYRQSALQCPVIVSPNPDTGVSSPHRTTPDSEDRNTVPLSLTILWKLLSITTKTIWGWHSYLHHYFLRPTWLRALVVLLRATYSKLGYSFHTFSIQSLQTIYMGYIIHKR